MSNSERAPYCWDIFNSQGVRAGELCGTPYRYWSSFAIAHVFRNRLSGAVDVLDAGGRDGGTLQLLKNLHLRGTYTCLDMEPKMIAAADPNFEISAIRSSFKDFQPPRKYDAILFQSCLEYVDSYSDIAWAQHCLKPGGFIVATISCRSARYLYWAMWANGGCHMLDEQELAPAFAEYGLNVVWICPLGGLASRAYQYLVHTYVANFVRMVYLNTIGRLFPKLKNRDPLASCYRLMNIAARWLDRLLPFRRTGHCVIAEPLD